MSALRLARGVTGRSKIIKFEGCYHGHADALLVQAGSGVATFGFPTALACRPKWCKHTLVAGIQQPGAAGRAPSQSTATSWPAS